MSPPIQSPVSPEPTSLALLLLPAFNAMATMAFLDPFRAANYLTGTELYTWDAVSAEGGSLPASNGLCVGETRALAAAGDRYDFVFVSSSWTPEAYGNQRLFEWLRRCAGKGAALGALDTGGFILAFAGLLEGRRVTVHYEHIAAFRETFPDLDIREDLFVIDRARLTCCGGAAAIDLALEMIRAKYGMDLANAVARYIFHDRLRAASEGQAAAHHEPVGYATPATLRRAVAAMERNLEDPLPLAAIAKRAGASQRQLERLFKAHTGVTAVQYYLEVRLDRAHGMVTQTDLSMLEIAIACGFASPEYFARAYKRRFGLAPSKDRREGRIPFQFRSFPSPSRRAPLPLGEAPSED